MMLALVALALSAGSALAQNYTRISDEIYLKQGGVALTLDVFKPEKPNKKAIVLMVSGGWSSDHNNINLEMAKLATDKGFTVIEVVHGAQPRYKVPEIVQQVKRAVRFTRANAAKYGIDPNMIGVTGGSSGGHLSLMIAASADAGNPNAKDPIDRVSSAVQAVGIYFPPVDFFTWGGANTFSFDNQFLKAAFGNAFVPDIRDATRDLAIQIAHKVNPIEFFTKAMPPTLIVHGDKDPLVPLQQSQLAVAKLTELGVPNNLIVVPGKQHGWPEMGVQFMDILAWFDKYLK